MFRPSSHSRATLKRTYCCLGIATVLLAVSSVAAKAQANRSCHDGSIPETSVQTSKTAQGAGPGGSESLDTHGIMLSWTASTTAPASVKGYYIFRRESGPSCESSKSKCEILNPATPIPGTSCTDYAVRPGHSYVYEAKTVGSNTAVSRFSNEANAKAR